MRREQRPIEGSLELNGTATASEKVIRNGSIADLWPLHRPIGMSISRIVCLFSSRLSSLPARQQSGGRSRPTFRIWSRCVTLKDVRVVTRRALELEVVVSQGFIVLLQ